ncbi:hypothetical protein RAH42_11095 [Pyramidobacter sp. YE332]|uniref:hypothetical protein n=1 Tax=Pyramidobacter sp. YE332 TaxID=3068894 RepID=UPI00294B930B|nr:hypothetical protein [Pyramidobacter sp. YE332]WOL39669.1 hypothetical protein RAH42_11095 [Pyramidobacter sp. YE332]
MLTKRKELHSLRFRAAQRKRRYDNAVLVEACAENENANELVALMCKQIGESGE